MASVHYFQRYSQRENVATNNALLLLSRVHHDSPAVFERLLGALLDDVDLTVGPSFRQQEGGRSSAGRGSVPDGTIYQPSFRIVVETKSGAPVDAEQLGRHLDRFGDEETQVLLLLTVHGTSPAFDADVRDRSNKERGSRVHYAPVTFTDLLSAARAVLPAHAYEMREVLDDFEAYCTGEGLLPSSPFKLRIVLCGETLDENVRYGLYYHPASRGYTALGYLGAYRMKSVRAVGKVRNTVTARVSGDVVEVVRSEGPTTPEDLAAIRGAVADGVANHGYTFDDDHVFFLVDRFYETDFRKESKYAPMGERHFDLRAVLGSATLPETAVIADRLRDVTWEEAAERTVPAP
jgi:hypothetical protein